MGIMKISVGWTPLHTYTYITKPYMILNPASMVITNKYKAPITINRTEILRDLCLANRQFLVTYNIRYYTCMNTNITGSHTYIEAIIAMPKFLSSSQTNKALTYDQ